MKNGEIDLCIGKPGSLNRRIINNTFKRLPTLSSRVWQTARRLTRLSGDISRLPCDGKHVSTIIIKLRLGHRAIITGKDSQYNSINDLKGTTFGISRLGRQVSDSADQIGSTKCWVQWLSSHGLSIVIAAKMV